jgi:hypothetical protein
MTETLMAIIVVGLMTWRVVRAIRLRRRYGRFTVRGLDPWVF